MCAGLLTTKQSSEGMSFLKQLLYQKPHLCTTQGCCTLEGSLAGQGTRWLCFPAPLLQKGSLKSVCTCPELFRFSDQSQKITAGTLEEKDATKPFSTVAAFLTANDRVPFCLNLEWNHRWRMFDSARDSSSSSKCTLQSQRQQYFNITPYPHHEL